MSDSQPEPEPQKPFSHHIFLFPFRWEYKHEDKNATFSAKSDPGEFENLLGSYWKRRTWQIGKGDYYGYNEYQYFYDFVREILYDLPDHDKSSKVREERLIRHYAFEALAPDDQVGIFEVTINGREKPYILEISDIHLNIYATGSAVLSFHLNNNREDQSSKNDILNINQFGRRIFPPFYDTDQDKQGDIKGLIGSQEKVLAKKIRLFLKSFDDKEPYAEENFQSFKELQNLSQSHFLPAYISKLFPKDVIEVSEKEVKTGQVHIQSALDDRMFVICDYCTDSATMHRLGRLTPKILFKKGKAYKSDDAPQYGYNTTSKEGIFWSKFVMIDTPKGGSFGFDPFREVLIPAYTYTRWLGYGTLYGITRYSLVCLYSKGAPDYVSAHMRTMYYKMAELALVQRASLVRFADEVTHLSYLKEGEETSLAEKIRELYRVYIRFVNKIYFREITPQEQGIDMYDMLQKHMRLDYQVKELDAEIEELSSYANMLEEKKRRQIAEDSLAQEKALEAERKKSEDDKKLKLDLITIFGALFIVPSFLFSFLGFEPIKDLLPDDKPWIILALSYAVLISLSVLIISFFRDSVKKLWESNKWRLILALGILFLALGSPIFLSSPVKGDEIKMGDTEKASPPMSKPEGKALPSDSPRIDSVKASQTTSDSDSNKSK